MAHQERQTQPIDLLQMRTPMLIAAVLMIRQNTEDRNLLTAVLAIHGLT
jgi:hypothetical protein